MSGQPSRSKSMRITPPLMDSTMYFFEGSEVWVKWIPVFAVMSSSCGMGRPLHLVDFAPGGGGGGALCPICAEVEVATRTIARSGAKHWGRVRKIKRLPIET